MNSEQVSDLRLQGAVIRAMGGFLMMACAGFLFAAPAFAAAPGGACGSNTDCSEGECSNPDIGCYCSGLVLSPTGTCELKRSAGEPCGGDALCRRGSTCNISTLACEADVPDAPAVPSAPAAGSGATTEPPATRTPGEFGYVNPLGTVNLNVVLGRVIRTALGFVGALFLAMFVYGGALWMTAGGDAAKVESGRNAIVNAVIGMVIVAISYSVISIIFETANVIRGG